MFLVVHSVIPHKQVRFVLLALIVLVCVMGSGVAGLARRLGRTPGGSLARTTIVFACFASWAYASLESVKSLSFARLGLYAGFPEANENPWTFRRDLNLAMMRVGARDDLCALAILPFGRNVGGSRLATTGGYTYLNRAVPMVIGQPSEELTPLVNYVVTCAGSDGDSIVPRGLEHVEAVGACAVYRRQEQFSCGSLESFARSWRW
jgi:hypothetical protein